MLGCATAASTKSRIGKLTRLRAKYSGMLGRMRVCIEKAGSVEEALAGLQAFNTDVVDLVQRSTLWGTKEEKWQAINDLRDFYSVLILIKEQEREIKRNRKKAKEKCYTANAKGNSSRVDSSLLTACRLTLEKLETQPKNGPLLDENWRCRKCGGLAADHPSITT